MPFGVAVLGRALLHWDGLAWSRIETTSFPGGVWARGTDDVWMTNMFTGIVVHWDGERLMEVFNRSERALLSIWGIGDEIWTVGRSGTVLHRRLE